MGPREEGQCQPEAVDLAREERCWRAQPGAPSLSLRLPAPAHPRPWLDSTSLGPAWLPRELTCLPRCASSPSIRIPITLHWNDY